jgi:hypothetical protein
VRGTTRQVVEGLLGDLKGLLGLIVLAIQLGQNGICIFRGLLFLLNVALQNRDHVAHLLHALISALEAGGLEARVRLV